MDLIGKTIGNYVVKTKLGSGGMGAVYLCEHPMLGRKVALKVLHEAQSRDPVTVERFFTEAKAANEIGNEHIVDILDFGSIPGADGQPDTYYLEMEYLRGRSLADCLGNLSVDESVHVARQCCDALAASHVKGIIHRDLKPDNIFLVEKTGDALFVKIVDFGIAKLMSGQGARTQLGTILGTPAYMSPEQCEGRGHIDQRTDIYSLGIVLYEMVTKRLPFPGPDLREIIVGQLREQPAPPSALNPHVTAALSSVILHALEKDPGRRFQSMAEMDRALADPETHLLASSRSLVEQPTIRADMAILAPRMLGPVAVGPTTDKAPVLPILHIPIPGTLDGAAGQVHPSARPAPRWALQLGGSAAIVVALAIAAVLASSQSPGPAPAPVSVLPVVTPATVPAPPAPMPPPVTEAAAMTVTPTAPAAAPPAAEPVPPPAEISLSIVTQPVGARVFRVEPGGDVALGTTPLVLAIEKGAKKLTVRVALAGYVTEVRTLGTDRSGETRIQLARKRRVAPRPEL